MDKVILVKIESRMDLLHFRSQDDDIKLDDCVIIQSITGEELGKVVKHFGDTFSAIQRHSLHPGDPAQGQQQGHREFSPKRSARNGAPMNTARTASRKGRSRSSWCG